MNDPIYEAESTKSHQTNGGKATPTVSQVTVIFYKEVGLECLIKKINFYFHNTFEK